MFFSKWKSHLSLETNKNNYWEVISDYFSFPNAVDMYKLNSSNLLSFSSMIDEFNCVYNDSIILELNFTINFDKDALAQLPSLNSFVEESLERAIELTQLKNNVDELVKIFPSMEDDIEILDLWTRFGEEYLQEVESTPDVKLYYPEPFIASPSFVHEELWFIHILHYQHWLWFMFISLIMFYFITFINVVRWCNLRNKPKRETRGVSRSKCADLITASVPVSWAASIIISETVDATDYYDGFGTGEIVIGIRAYQWGWEYFYPKSIDLNYNVKPSYSTFVGNSLKYNNSNSKNLDSNSFWKSYQNKTSQSITISPSYLLTSPTDKESVVDISNFSKVGLSSIKDSSAFKKIQYHSKSPAGNLFGSDALTYSKFEVLNTLYNNSIGLANCKDYYTDRQDNYTSLLSSQLGANSNLESKALDKYLNYNFNLKLDKSSPNFFNNVTSSNLDNENFKDVSKSRNHANSIFSLTDIYAPQVNLPKQINKYNVNTASDGKQYNNLVKPLLDPSILRKNAISANDNTTIDLYGHSNTDIIASKFSNLDRTSKFKDLKSSNMGFLSSDKNSRLVSKIQSSKGQHNFSSNTSNLEDILSSLSNYDTSTSESALYKLSSKGWVSSKSLDKITSFNSSTSSQNSPIYSNDSYWMDKEFNKYQSFNNDQPSKIFKSKEEAAPLHLFSEYWETIWANSNNNNRIKNNLVSQLFTSSFYLPAIEEYAEYDFKNWQALESLEDCFWESTFSSFIQDEYLTTLNNYLESSSLKRQEELYSSSSQLHKFKNSKIYKPEKTNSGVNSISLFSKEGFFNAPLTSKKNFLSVSNESALDVVDDSYESFKSQSLNILLSNALTKLNNNYFIMPYNYTKVIDPFRADYEELLWQFDTSANDFKAELTTDSLNSRLSNSMKLRSTTRNAIISYNAMQKVFKSRLDEGRSHSRLSDFSNSYTPHNFVTAPKAKYEAMLSKNKNSFFDINLYSQSYSDSFTLFSSIYNSLNSMLIDIPFLMSYKSDPSRHLWFDWQSRWSSLEIQPASAARYSLSGVPYFSKSLEFDTHAGDILNESENYLNRLARARKNYLSNWAHSPFFYSRSLVLRKPTSSNSYIKNSSMKALLLESSMFWDDIYISNSTSTKFSSTSSGVNTPAKSSWRPYYNAQGLVYDTGTLSDIISKREHLYRCYINSFNLIASLPNHISASPNNPIVDEISKSYRYIDPSSISSELSRDIMYTDLNFIKLSVIINCYKTLDSYATYLGINTSLVNDYVSKYLLGFNFDESLGANKELYKNQYRPLKKGVTNMIRLQASGAISMPIEIRLHILASSRDVIHSWAIPSAGIKIDCVPGYSSHRITIFLVSGIFWGQCMEICGRFHHWMPIIVYFMKRDMFFLWCTHFMHYSSDLDLFNMTDRQLADKIRIASFDKTSWTDEVNNSL